MDRKWPAAVAALCLVVSGGCGGDIDRLEADGSLTGVRLDSLMALPAGVYVEGRTTVRAAPESVWTVFSDFNRWRDWDPVLFRAQTTEGDALEWGLHFTQTYATRPVRVTTRNVVLRLVPGREVVWKGEFWGLRILQAVSFRAAEGGGTEVTIRSRVTGALALLLEERLRAGARRALGQTLGGLRAYCEAHSPAAVSATESPPPAFAPIPDGVATDTVEVDTVWVSREVRDTTAADTTAADTTAADTTVNDER